MPQRPVESTAVGPGLLSRQHIWVLCGADRRAPSLPQWEGCGCGVGGATHRPIIVGGCDPT